jgi:hypothetical protein
MRNLMRAAWDYRKARKMEWGVSLRLAWLSFTKLPAGVQLVPFTVFANEFNILNNGQHVGQVRVLVGGYYQASNLSRSSKLVRNRLDAVAFAVSKKVERRPDQLPLF